MRWMLTPTPPVWYCLFWVSMLGGLYFVVKWAIIAALNGR